MPSINPRARPHAEAEELGNGMEPGPRDQDELDEEELDEEDELDDEDDELDLDDDD